MLKLILFQTRAAAVGRPS